jgi:hypothetical protein
VPAGPGRITAGEGDEGTAFPTPARAMRRGPGVACEYESFAFILEPTSCRGSTVTVPDNSSASHPTPAHTLSATLYLISRVALDGGCPRIYQIVIEHLEALAGDAGVDPLLRSTTHRLLCVWERAAAFEAGSAADRERASALMRETLRKAMKS